jgi:hypothetical protein
MAPTHLNHDAWRQLVSVEDFAVERCGEWRALVLWCFDAVYTASWDPLLRLRIKPAKPNLTSHPACLCALLNHCLCVRACVLAQALGVDDGKLLIPLILIPTIIFIIYQVDIDLDIIIYQGFAQSSSPPLSSSSSSTTVINPHPHRSLLHP